MNRMKIVARETFLRQIKSGAFWFMVLFPIIMMAISLLIGYFTGSSSGEMAIVTDDNLKAYFEDNPNYDFKITSEEELKKLLDDKEVSSYAKVREEDGIVVADYFEGKASMSEKVILQTTLGQIQNGINMKNANLKEDQVKSLAKSPVINQIADKNQDNKFLGMAIYFVFLILMYMITLTFINVILTETATEKGTKMIEFIFSSVRPGEYFEGKILGNFGAVLVQIAIYIIMGTIGFNIANAYGLLDGLPLDFSIHANSLAIFAEIIVLFLLGIFLFLVVAGMLGSFATKIEDAGKMGMPLTMGIVIMFFLAMTLMNKGDVIISKILSYLPFASTFFMPLRLLNGYANLLSGIIAIAILLIAIFLFYKFGEKVYKKNILNYSTEGFFSKKKKNK